MCLTFDNAENASAVPELLNVLEIRSYIATKSSGHTFGVNKGHRIDDSSGDSIIVNRSSFVLGGLLAINLYTTADKSHTDTKTHTHTHTHTVTHTHTHTHTHTQ